MLRALGVRGLRRSQLVLGALIIGIPASAGMVTAGRALAANVAAQPSSSGTLATHLKSRRITYGQDVVVVGSAPASQSGQQLELQFAPAGATGSWSTLRSTTVPSSGRFRLAAPLKRSGLVRVVNSSSSTTASTASADPSGTHPVSVAARLHVRGRELNELGSHRVDIRGTLLPGIAGRKVKLEGGTGRGWETLAVARTRAGGEFDLHYTATGGQQQLRVRFGGDGTNTSTGARAGTVTVFEQTVASWYNDGGSTACGFHAYYGVANRTLPCGTKVTFRNGGRMVTATVDDRGPYVGGRDWDLNQNTAGALGFGGVGTIWASL
jgi:peptidoglycan lytic transglycosylase